MKKTILYVSMLFVAIATSSCSSDDGDKGSTASLVGKWELTKDGMIDDGVEWLDNYTHLCATKKDYTEYTSTGQATSAEYDSSCNEDKTTATYTYANKKIALTVSGTVFNFDVVELTGTTLKVKLEPTPGYGDVYVFKRVN